MPNHITSLVELIGSETDIQSLINDFSTFYPSEPAKSYDGDLIYKKEGTEHEYGRLKEETGVFFRRGEEDVVGVPDGYIQYFETEWTRFPDFAKVIPPPNDDAYNDKPNQDVANKSPNWWYTWNSKHWGTKWNSYSCKKISNTVYQFNTAWAGVPHILEIISKKYPSVHIKYTYADEDSGYNVGCYEFHNGCSKKNVPDGGTKEAYDIYFTVNPDEKVNYELIDGTYKYKDEEEN